MRNLHFQPLRLVDRKESDQIQAGRANNAKQMMAKRPIWSKKRPQMKNYWLIERRRTHLKLFSLGSGGLQQVTGT